MRTFHCAICIFLLCSPAFGLIGPAPEGVAIGEYDPVTGEFVVSSGGVVNVYLNSSSSTLVVLGNPRPTPPDNTLISYNNSRVGLVSLTGIDVTNFSFGNIGTNLSPDDLVLHYNPALGVPLVSVPATPRGNVYVFGEFGETSSFIADPRPGSTLSFSFPQPNRSISLSKSGSNPISVNGLQLSGPDAGLFELTTPELPFSLDSGHPFQLGVTYTAEVPSLSGPMAQVAIALSNGEILEYLLTATHPLTYSPQPGSSINFGSAFFEENSEIVRQDALVIKNESTIPFDVVSVRLDGPDASSFSTQGPILPYAITPADPFRLGITFAPDDASAARAYNAMLNVGISDGRTLTFDVRANLVSIPGDSNVRVLYDALSGVLHIDSTGMLQVLVTHRQSGFTPTDADAAPAGSLLTLNSSRVGLTSLGPLNASWSVNIGSGIDPRDLVLTFADRFGAPAVSVPCGSGVFSCIAVPEPGIANAWGQWAMIAFLRNRASTARRTQR